MRYLILLLFVSSAFAEVVPAARRVDWVPGFTIGVKGGIPTNMTMYTNIYLAGCDKTGVTNCNSILSTLMNSCPSNQYLYAPAGTYTNSAAITHNGTTNGWELRGDGTNTIFKLAGGLFNADSQVNIGPYPLHGSFLKGATNLTTAGQDMSGLIGKTILINRSENTNNPDIQVINIFFYDRIFRMLAVVTSVSNNTNFTIDRPLQWDFHANYSPWIYYNNTVSERIGFRDITVEAGSSSAFSIFGSRFFWWKHVKCIQGNGYFLNDANNLGFEIRDCYSTSTNVGSGTAIFNFSASTGHWAENNYGIGGSPVFEVNACSYYCISYNYATNNASDPNEGAGSYVGNPYSIHGAHGMMGLWEGNSGTMLQAPDSYFGSASHNVVYRNNFHAWDPIRSFMPRAIHLGRWGTYWSYVGNVLGSTNRTGWYYQMTNDSYAASIPVVYALGYSAPGHSNYRQQNNGSDWRFPGHQNRVGAITNTATVPTNRIAGTFTNVSIGEFLIIQASSDTNYYYPLTTNFIVTTVTDVQAAYVEINRSIVSTNTDVIFKFGDGSYFDQLHWPLMIDTTLFHGNSDVSNGFDVIIWDRSGTVTDSNLPPSLIDGYTSTPSWFTNRQYGTNLTWPPVNPTNGFVGDFSARSLWEDGNFAGGGGITGNSNRQNKNKGNAGSRNKR